MRALEIFLGGIGEESNRTSRYSVSRASVQPGSRWRALRVIVAGLALALLLISAPTVAQDTEAPIPDDPAGISPAGTPPYVEYALRTKAAQQVEPLTSDLFGDQVSLYSGQTTFSNVDIDIPGNSPDLPVQLRRRWAVTAIPRGVFHHPYGGIGNWDIDVPFITGTFDAGAGWRVPGFNGQVRSRCEYIFDPTVSNGFAPGELFAGINVHLPGRGEKQMMYQPHGPGSSDHRWTTSDFDRFTCLSDTANEGVPGTGAFLMHTADGLTYRFDWHAERTAWLLKRGNLSKARKKVYLLATRITDRHGNYVQYTYNAVGHPTKIEGFRRGGAADGRKIDLHYQSGRLETAKVSATDVPPGARDRIWRYQYNGAHMRHVILPDAPETDPGKSRWTYEYSNDFIFEPEAWDGENGPNCVEPPAKIFELLVIVTHPSGASGSFQF